jgi:hypothetical protein
MEMEKLNLVKIFDADQGNDAVTHQVLNHEACGTGSVILLVIMQPVVCRYQLFSPDCCCDCDHYYFRNKNVLFSLVNECINKLTDTLEFNCLITLSYPQVWSAWQNLLCNSVWNAFRAVEIQYI